MKYTTLGKTGLKISRMGFGGIPIQRIDAEGTKKLMKQLAEEGVNYIDTARGYTVSEEYLGYALEGIRDKFVIATKSMARTREAMAADIEKSLGNLRTNHIDLYQVPNVLQNGRSSSMVWERLNGAQRSNEPKRSKPACPAWCLSGRPNGSTALAVSMPNALRSGPV